MKPYFLAILLVFTTHRSFSQNINNVLKTKTGFLAVCNSYRLNFTLRVDGNKIETPSWINSKELMLIDDVLFFSFQLPEEIQTNKDSQLSALELFEKAKIKDLKKGLKSGFEISEFKKDTFNFGQNTLTYNAWYYVLEKDQNKFYFYYFDLYTNNVLIRLTLKQFPNLNMIHEMVDVLFGGFTTYEHTINLDLLEVELSNGNYSY